MTVELTSLHALITWFCLTAPVFLVTWCATLISLQQHSLFYTRGIETVKFRFGDVECLAKAIAVGPHAEIYTNSNLYSIIYAICLAELFFK